MRNRSNFLLSLVLLAVSVLSLSSCRERIDAGYAGIQVDQYGTDKGTASVELVHGSVWYNPFTKSVYESPTFVQTVAYTEENGNHFTVTTKDGLSASFDVSFSYRTPEEAVVSIFNKYRRPVEELEPTILHRDLNTAFNNAAANYTAEQLYSQRMEFQTEAVNNIKEILHPDGFVVEQVSILNNIRLPKNIVDNINAKIAATQIAIKKQQEVAQAKADADKTIETARGKAQSLLLQAEAEAKANNLKQTTLTPMLLSQQWIERWNGVLPNTMAGDSKNSTMMFIPGK